MANQANSLLTTKNAAGGPLGSPNSCVSPANRIEPRQETGGALLCSHVAGRRAHCHPALHRRPAFLPIRREGARPARSWLRVSVWNFPALYRPVQVDQRDLVIALSGSRRVLVRVQAGPCFRWEADQPTDRPIGLQTLFGARVHPFKAARLFSLGIFPTASI